MNESSYSQQIANELTQVAQNIVQHLPRCRALISSITYQAKYHHLDPEIQKLNKLMFDICKKKKFGFINNNNISLEDLNNSGLHLNEHGSAKLACNFRDCIKASHAA